MKYLLAFLLIVLLLFCGCNEELSPKWQLLYQSVWNCTDENDCLEKFDDCAYHSDTSAVLCGEIYLEKIKVIKEQKAKQ